MKLSKLLVLAVSLTSLSACGGSQIENVQVGDVQVRQIPAGGMEDYPDGPVQLFVFIPVETRSLEERIGIVEQYLAQEGKCQLGTTDRATIGQLTAGADGDGQRVLMAPIQC